MRTSRLGILLIPCAIVLGACNDRPQGATTVAPDAVKSAPAQPGSSATASSATNAAVQVKLSRTGVEQDGKLHAILEGGKLPTEEAAVERVQPIVHAWVKGLESEARARFAARNAPDAEPEPMPVAFAIQPDVHPTTVLDVISLLPKFTGGVYELAVEGKEGGRPTPLTTFSRAGVPGPHAPEDWACSGAKQPLLDVVLVARGKVGIDTPPGSLLPLMLRHDKSGAPNWAQLEKDAREAKPDVTCLMWVGPSDTLRMDEFLQGISTAWRVIGRELPIVYVPFDGPEG
ncbi:MAG: hypothetical protein HOW73_22525 [Polyangiaceae bacterium]|nr:hypothetical protein [Polyangiaceae bacterium]